MPGQGLDLVRTMVPLHELSCTGKNCGPGVGEPMPTAITQVKHVCTLGGPEQPPPIHDAVRKGGGTKAPEAGQRRSLRRNGDILTGLWAVTRNGSII